MKGESVLFTTLILLLVISGFAGSYAGVPMDEPNDLQIESLENGNVSGGKPGMGEGATQVTKPPTSGKDIGKGGEVTKPSDSGKEIGKGGEVTKPDNPDDEETQKKCEKYCSQEREDCIKGCNTKRYENLNELNEILNDCLGSCVNILWIIYNTCDDCNAGYSLSYDLIQEDFDACKENCRESDYDKCLMTCSKEGPPPSAVKVTRPESGGKDLGKEGEVAKPESPQDTECQEACGDTCGENRQECISGCTTTRYEAYNTAVEIRTECRNSCFNFFWILNTCDDCDRTFDLEYNRIEEEFSACKEDCRESDYDQCMMLCEKENCQ